MLPFVEFYGSQNKKKKKKKTETKTLTKKV